MAAVNQTDSAPASSYDSELASAVNQLSHSVLGRELYPNFRGPNKYTGIAKNLSVCLNILTNFFYFLIICSIFFIATGELIGVEYLYAQTEKTLQNIPDQQEEAETPIDAPLIIYFSESSFQMIYRSLLRKRIISL